MNVKSSGIRLKKRAAPFQTLAEFCNAILRNAEINMACYSDHLCKPGWVSVYLRNANTEAGYNGGTITLEAFNELRAWASQLKDRQIVFSGKLVKKAS